MANSGLGSQLGFVKETTWGTAVTPTRFYRFENESFTVDPTYVDPIGLAAGTTVAPQQLTKQTTRTAGGGFSMYAPYRLTGALLDQMVAGTITPVQQAATIAYLSTFNVGSSVPVKSGTVQINKPSTNGGDNAYTYPGSVLTSAEFSMATGGVLMSNWNWLSKDETTPSTTPAGAALATASYAASDDVWTHVDTSLTYAGGAVNGITGVTLNWTQPMADGRFFLGSGATRAKPIPNNVATITGTLTGEFYDNTLYAAYRAGTFANLTITFAGLTPIASTYYPTIKFTMAGVQLRGSSPQVGGPDLLDLSVPFVAKNNGSNPPLVIEYTSTESVAW